MCLKKVHTLIFDNNFAKCEPIFKILSPPDTKPQQQQHSRAVHGNGNPRGNGIPMGIPWEWE